MKRIVWLFAAAACSGGSSISVPADRPALSYTGASATDANKAKLPAGFTAPDAHACAADPTRAYLGELFVNGLDNPEVFWHWAPIVSGDQPAQPTLSQPEFSVQGTLRGADDSGDDVLADHPFGTDVDADLEPDPGYGFLQFDTRTSTTLHTEVENRIFPRDALGFTPQKDDRALMRGAWVLDCGHPPYGAEMHPPTFLAYARSDAKTTLAATVVAPYRSTLLFSQDASAAVALDNTARYGASKPFELAMVDAVEQAIVVNAQNITLHAMMTANRFEPIDFLVCAPLPKPAGASFDASWRFTARTGVNLVVSRIDGAGCVRVQATMDAKTYKPMALQYASAPWTWEQLSTSASEQIGAAIDVRQQIIDALKSKGLDASNAPSLQPANPPLIDAYAALQPLPGADQDSPTAIATAADAQPFPFYGRVRAAWK